MYSYIPVSTVCTTTVCTSTYKYVLVHTSRTYEYVLEHTSTGRPHVPLARWRVTLVTLPRHGLHPNRAVLVQQHRNRPMPICVCWGKPTNAHRMAGRWSARPMNNCTGFVFRKIQYSIDQCISTAKSRKLARRCDLWQQRAAL